MSNVYWFGVAMDPGGGWPYGRIIERDPTADTWTTKFTTPDQINTGVTWAEFLVDTRDGRHFAGLLTSNFAVGQHLYEGTFDSMTKNVLPTTITRASGIYVAGPGNVVFVGLKSPNQAVLYHWNGSTLTEVLNLGTWWASYFLNMVDGHNGVVACRHGTNVYVNTTGDLASPGAWVSLGNPTTLDQASSIAVTRVVDTTDYEIHVGRYNEYSANINYIYTPTAGWTSYTRYGAGGVPLSSYAATRRDDDDIRLHIVGPERIARYQSGSWIEAFDLTPYGSTVHHGRHLAGIDCTVFGGHGGVENRAVIFERRWNTDPTWQYYNVATVVPGNVYEHAYKIAVGEAGGTIRTMPGGGSLMAGDKHQHIEERWRRDLRLRRR